MNPSISEGLKALRAGQPILCLIRDGSGSTRGSLILAAENATPAGVNMLALEGRGVVCVGIDAQIAERLELGPMVPLTNASNMVDAVSTISIDARVGTTTGISASDRAVTLRLLTADTATSDDFVRPGHLFPYVAHELGVLGRPEAAEAAVDLMRLLGMKPAAAFCGVLDKDGHLADAEYLAELAARTGLATVTMEDLIDHRLLHSRYLTCTDQGPVDTDQGPFHMQRFFDSVHDDEHHVLKSGLSSDRVATVYVHQACVQGDVFGDKACSSRQQLEAGLEQVKADGGILVYLGSRTPLERGLSVAAQLIQASGVTSVRPVGKHGPRMAQRLGELDISVYGAEHGDAASDGQKSREAMTGRL